MRAATPVQAPRRVVATACDGGEARRLVAIEQQLQAFARRALAIHMVVSASTVGTGLVVIAWRCLPVLIASAQP